MVEPTNGGRPEDQGRLFPNWRVILSAWAVVAIFAILFAVVYALSPPRSAPERAAHGPLVIPKHEPQCGPLGSPTNSGACPKPLPYFAPQMPF